MAPERGGLARAAIARIEADALDTGSLSALARSLFVTPRHLRRAIRSQFGTSPLELAQARRLGLAAQLVERSRLTLTEVAFASGFGSLRRFNAAFAQAFGGPPSAWRRNAARPAPARTLLLDLRHRTARDWRTALRRLDAQAVAGIESVSELVYCRTARFGRQRGWIALYPSARRGFLCVELPLSLARSVSAVVDSVERLLDAGGFGDFESGVKTILRGDPALAGRFVEAFGAPLAVRCSPLTRLFPRARDLGGAAERGFARIGLDGERARAICALAVERAFEEGT